MLQLITLIFILESIFQKFIYITTLNKTKHENEKKKKIDEDESHLVFKVNTS